ncbi:putative ABC transporter permease [Oceaniovalibus guishaninsula JLT2003]|uniref:Putative ABC transporter permease n=1 Tax=Oceaniovalibus guishaninsula JLT2003 TaxID=1231392 RepID=K2GKE6_9RHOB|nr:ABC transporter permease [Oceaniovalibus guishaninsula]EKE43211.1 putative ABC transporter permease [Oceaniovalibus guishaninsula JLT2003]
MTRRGWIVPLAALALIALVPGLRAVALGFLDGAFGGRNLFNLWSTLSRASILLGMAIAVLVAFRAGLINLGGEGQLVLGALAAALVGIYAPLPGWAVASAALLAATVAGGLWGMLALWLDRGLRVPLLVGSLLLNYPAVQFASWLASHPLRDVASGSAQTHRIDGAARLPRFDGTILDYGIFLTVAVALLAILADRYTVFGYRLRMQGLAPDFARAQGMPTRRLGYQALFLSGAIAGLTGFTAVFGFAQRYVDGMLTQPLYAWTGIVAVLLAGMVPWRVPVAALIFAVLATGAGGMERVAGIPRESAQIVIALAILWLAGSGRSPMPGRGR